MQHLRRVIVGTAALMLTLATGTCGAQASDDPVLATVNGQPIMASHLREQLIHRWGDITLGALIQELAVQQAAAEAGVTVTENEVNERAESFQRGIDLRAPATGESFSLWLARHKMTTYSFRKWMRNELLLEKMVADEAQATDEEVQQVWEASKDRLRQPERMRVSHICVKTREEAEQIRAEIVGGKAFEEAAREYSIDPYTKDDGGKFGIITRGENPFQEAAFALEADSELSQPVQTQKGWHIIRRDEYLPASTPEFEDVEDDLRQRIQQRKLMQLMEKKRSEIMQSARIEREMDPDDLTF